MSEKSSLSSLSVIIPCYNEAPAIAAFQVELLNFISHFARVCPESTLEIIVVNNNSSDASPVLLKQLQATDPHIKITDCLKQGYGAALKHGFSIATSEAISFLDLDNTYPLLSLIELYDRIRCEDLDIIYGARIHGNSDIPLIRRIGNQFYVLLLRTLLGCSLSDVCSGMRIFRKNHLAEVLALGADDLSFSIELTSVAVRCSWKMAEEKIPYRERLGESKLSVVKDGLLFLLVVLKHSFSKSGR